MKLLHKLLIILLFVGLVPLALAGYFSVQVNQDALIRQVEEQHLRNGRQLSADIEKYVRDLLRNVELQLGYIAFRDFGRQELDGGLNVIYLQHDAITVAWLLDERGRAPAGVAPKHITDLRDYDDRYRNHHEVSLEELEVFKQHIPRDAALAGRTAIGDVYTSARKRMALLPVALPLPGGPTDKRWVLALEISLDEIQDMVTARTWGTQARALLFDGAGKLLAHPDAARALARTSVSDLSIVGAALAGGASGVSRFEERGVSHLGAWARLPTLGWGVVLAHPMADALATADEMRRQTLFWLAASLVFATAIAAFFAQGISGPVKRLASGARAIAAGELEHRLPTVAARDEIGDLSRAFNDMGSELKQSYDRIAEQNRELESWNAELVQRVEERTSALKEAQDQLLQSQKLSAVGELGAGVAHEINNPLAAVLGLTQILLMKSAKKEDEATHGTLKQVEKEAMRIRDIVQNLLRLSQHQEGEAFTPLDLCRVVEDALSMVQVQLEDRGVKIERKLVPVPKVLGDTRQLQQVVLHLVTNARNAMPRGGTLTLETSVVEGQAVRVHVRDTGRGIPKENLPRIFEPFFTTKDEWSGKGLGLSMAYKIVDSHKGRITVESEVGVGSTFTLTFPAVSGRTQLA